MCTKDVGALCKQSAPPFATDGASLAIREQNSFFQSAAKSLKEEIFFMHHDWRLHERLESRLQTGFQRLAGALQVEKKNRKLQDEGEWMLEEIREENCMKTSQRPSL